ncbi:MAG: type 1 periplasmic-binding domain-containing protein [Acidimicrobiales bacterium]
MTPFLQFRLWARRAPLSERAITALSLLAVLALLSWAFVPSPTHTSVVIEPTGAGVSSGPGVGATSGDSIPAGPAAGSAAGQAALTPSTVGGLVTSGARPGSGAAGGGPSASVGAVGPAGPGPGTVGPSSSASGSSTCSGKRAATDQGVSATQIHLGVILLNLGGPGPVANSALGIPGPQQQQDMATAIIDSINKRGGVACRQLTATYYQADPLDSSSEHAACLQLAQDRVFAALDGGGLTVPPNVRDCVPREHIPLFTPTALLASEASQFFPYLFSHFGREDELIRDSVLASRDLGSFDRAKGFNKLGLLVDDCAPEVSVEAEQSLSQIGIGSNQISKYDIGCPSTAQATPDQLGQAVLQFKAANVSHLLPTVGAPTLSNFTRVAQVQGFNPRYLVPDYQGQINLLETPSQQPQPDNFNGALGITPTRIGLFNSGLPVNPGTKECDQVLASRGIAPISESSYSEGTFCSEFLMFEAAASHAPNLVRTELAAGLDRSGSLDFAYQTGPGLFDQPRQVSGGSYWEPVRWLSSCKCWKVIGPFRPNY